ncbi:hypothetical protein [Saccharothrix australiensis]|uniref:Uncharacterized protein n=1 Tax=Saccharothrix australiensis TaxID=2072 RepID=A0A495W8G0_9PSEU|nr:hypothetical protein [Saccharothrix australiensis]RKT57986.1 hypothetical protein C8E97_6721 [Saccharothrix australiensis]
MTSSPCTVAQQVPNLYAVVDEDEAVAAWIIKLRPDQVVTIFPDGTTTHAADSTRRALDFVNLAEGIDGHCVTAVTGSGSSSSEENSEPL